MKLCLFACFAAITPLDGHCLFSLLCFTSVYHVVINDLLSITALHNFCLHWRKTIEGYGNYMKLFYPRSWRCYLGKNKREVAIEDDMPEAKVIEILSSYLSCRTRA